MQYNHATLKESINDNALYDWVIGYLNGPGRNKGLIERHIKKDNYNKAELRSCQFSDLAQIAGPSKKFLFPQKKLQWCLSINRMKKDIKNGWRPLPLIVMVGDMKGKKLVLSDGNHRMVALKKCGYKEYESIILSQ